MKRHSIVVRLGTTDNASIPLRDRGSRVANLRFVNSNRRLDYGIGQMLDSLVKRGLYASEAAIDLAILAATVTAADTTVSRAEHAQDSWTREIDLYLPVADPDLWVANLRLIKRILDYLTGDLWRLTFRPRLGNERLALSRPMQRPTNTYDSVALFSGGLDSFVGAIDLLEQRRQPLFVSHYGDASTSRQHVCAIQLGRSYGDLDPRHVRANVRFDKNDIGWGRETTTRGRSFIFFSLAAIAASATSDRTPIIVPENGLISLNVPLDSLRIGSRSTRTTHPFYMARWQELLDNLGIDAVLCNPYRFKTKGEMIAGCKNRNFLQTHLDKTISCSSITKGRWKGHTLGHCGYCTPCLIRRASIRKALGNDPTTYSIGDLDAYPLRAYQAESIDVRAFQAICRKLRDRPQLANYLVHIPGPLTDYSSSEVAQYAALLKRGLDEVGALVNGVKIQA